jgi:hypothetical protein
MCGLCNEMIPAGDSFAIFFDPRMLLAFVNCHACRAEAPYDNWRYLTVQEVSE